MPPTTVSAATTPPSPTQAASQQKGGDLAKGKADEVGNNLKDNKHQQTLTKDRADELFTKTRTLAKNEVKAALQPQSRTSPNAPAVIKRQEKVLHDFDLVEKLARDREEGIRLKKAEAEKAFNPNIRKNLLSLVENEETQVRLKKEEIDLTKTFSQLMQIASTAAQRSKGMATASAPNGRAPASLLSDGSSETGSGLDLARSKQSAGISTSDYEAELTTRLEAALAKAEAEEKTAGRPPLTAQQKAQLREKLSNSLRGQLTAYYKAKAAEAALATASAYAPEGQLKREQVSAPAAEEASAEPSHGMGDVIGSTFSAFQNQSPENGFAMQASETEAAVNGFLDESNRDLASDPASGLLGEDSPALFIRVSEVYRRHEKRFVTN